MKKLNLLINQLENKIDFFETKNLAVSEGSVGWQIDHCLRVIIGVITVLKKSNPDDFKWKFNFPRLVVFTLNKIPRGKANAPKTVRSFEKILKQDLIDKIQNAKLLDKNLNDLDKKNNFVHPYFGNLNLKQTIKFLNIHTKHHLKIIKDIGYVL